LSLEKFITDILNIELNDNESMSSIDKSDGSLVIKIKLKRKNDVCCPYCGGNVKIHGYYERKLIHSTLINRKCYIIYQERRYICEPCELTFHETNPFVNAKENVTIETKINVLKDLKFANTTYTSAARRQNLSVTKVIRIFDTHVDIKRKPLPEVLSIDEHYFKESSYDSLYMCILMDFKDGTIIDVLADRKKDFLRGYFSKIKALTYDEKTHTSELDNVKYVSIDLYENYRDIAKIYFPNAIICADIWHVEKHLTEGFRDLRIRCRNSSEDEVMRYLISRFKFIFDHNINLDNEAKYNKRLKRYINYRQIMELLFERFPDLKKGYELKEAYLYFNEHSNINNARENLTNIVKDFADSDIKEYDEFYNILINWFDEIVNSFHIINGRRINNSYIESRNSNIEKLFYNANGFTNFKRTRNRILYCLNKNDTYKI